MESFDFCLKNDFVYETLHRSVNMVGEQILRLDAFYGHDYGEKHLSILSHMGDLNAQWWNLTLCVNVDLLDTPELNFYHEVQSVLQTWILDKL